MTTTINIITIINTIMPLRVSDFRHDAIQPMNALPREISPNAPNGTTKVLQAAQQKVHCFQSASNVVPNLLGELELGTHAGPKQHIDCSISYRNVHDKHNGLLANAWFSKLGPT